MTDWKEVVAGDLPDWAVKQGRVFEPIPEWQREVIETVVPDMTASRPLTLCFAYEPNSMSLLPSRLGDIEGSGPLFEGANVMYWKGQEPVWEHSSDPALWAWVEGEQGASGTGLQPDEPRFEQLVEFAHWLQDQVIPESDAAWAQPSPPCPGHGHPAEPQEIDREAWWTCPVDGYRKIALIGRLRAVS